MEARELAIQNYNNKLANEFFIHIEKAPVNPIMESSLPFLFHIKETVTSSKTALDMLASGQQNIPISFTAHMIDLMRMELWQIGSVLTFLSHGVGREDFVAQLKKNNPEIKQSDKYAVYIFKKIK